MGSARVRNGRTEDREAALDAYLAANDARRGGLPTPAHHVERVRGSLANPAALFLIAEDAGVCVGMALAMQGLADDGAGPPVPGLCYLSMVFVRPERWGEGIGCKLVSAMLAAAQSAGYERIELWTHADNGRSQRLYERLGFRQTGREKENDLGEWIVLYGRAIG
jgi:ribosomal protein S18 acetylase RimI-like enzyme